MSLKTVVSYGKENFEDASRLRIQVFIEEQGFSVEFDDIDENAVHFVLYDNELPVAVARYYGDNNPYHVGRIAVKKEYRKNGTGRYLMNKVFEYAKEHGADSLILSAQTRVAGFYEKLGFTQIGQEYFDEFCPHIDMIKSL